MAPSCLVRFSCPVTCRRLVRPCATLIWLASIVAGCSSENDPPAPASDEEQDRPEPSNPAVVLAGQVHTPDDFLTYVGVFPKVPTGDVDFATFREFGNANVSVHGGYVFVEEAGVMTRFSVNEDLELVDEERFSWKNFGVGAINASYNVFVSDRRAFAFAPDLGLVVVWDPEKMSLVDTVEFDLPKRADGMFTYAYDGHVVGDNVIWNLISDNWDAGTIHPAVTLAILDSAAKDPLRFIEDDRCIPGGPSFVGAGGDYYINAGAEYGYFAAYGEQAGGRTCILRVQAGETEFDADYLLDYKELTGSYYTYPWIRVTDTQWFAYAWDPEVELPESSEDYWDNSAFRPILVDLETESYEAYPDLTGGKQISAIQYQVDDNTYFEFSETGYVESGESTVMRLGSGGATEQFHMPGFLLALERLR